MPFIQALGISDPAFIILELIAIIIYASIFVMAVIGAILYNYAYREMKRTRIIGALAMLLTAIAIDTGWWMATEFVRFEGDTKSYIPWMVHPIALIISKLIIAGAVIYFVLASVREDKNALKYCTEVLKKRMRGKTKWHIK